MSDPRRLSEVSDNEVERLLLDAGRESAPKGAKHRAWMAASAALATTTVATGTAAGAGAAGHAAAIAKAGSVASLKWIGVMSLVGLGAAAGAIVMQEKTREAPVETQVVAPPVTAAPTGVRTADSAVTATATLPVPSAPTPTPAPTPTTTPPRASSSVSSSPSTAAELSALDAARSALNSGDPPRALALLDLYARDFPHGTLAPEATLLRIESLVAAGDRNSAQRTATIFLTANPNSPYAKRIQSLLQGAP